VLVLAILVIARTSAHDVSAQQLLADPEAFYGKVVRVEGTADMVTPRVAGYRAFRLTDEEASVWVVSRLGAPVDGSRVVVQGKVTTGVRTRLSVLGVVNVGTFIVEDKRGEP